MTSLAEKKLPRVSARSGRPAPELIFGDLWEFDPSPETADPKVKTRYDLFIDGKFVAPKLGKYFDSINPANEQKLAEIAQASAADVDAAYQAAKAAYDNVWGKLPGRERAKYLFRIARLLQDRAREFAVAETLDGGKPIKESRTSMCRWRRRTFSITPVGRTNSTTWRRVVGSRRSVWWAK